MKELKFNLKILLYRKELYFAIFIVFLVNLIQCFMAIQYSSGLNLFVENGYSAEYQTILYNGMVSLNSIVIIVFPIVCSMIFSDSSWCENNDKTFHVLYPRINHRRNSMIRYVLSFLVPFVICFLGFMMNYGIMRLIFQSGTLSTFSNDVGFCIGTSKNFLDHLRILNPAAYIVSISCVVSLAIGLLSSLSYSLSVFFKKRVFIYFIPLLTIILFELILSQLKLSSLSFIRLLQPTTHFSMRDVILISMIVISIGLFIEFIKGKKKDHLL